VARSQRCTCGHLKFGKARGDGGQCAAVEAIEGSRGEFGRVGRQWRAVDGVLARDGNGDVYL
jgi:hypothetical protein